MRTCHLDGLQAHSSLFIGCNFTGLQVPGIQFVRCTLQDADFTGADLSGARFGGSPQDPTPDGTVGWDGVALGIEYYGSGPVVSTSFEGADLTTATFHNAFLKGAQFTGADAAGVVASGFTNFDGAVFGTGWATSTWTGATSFVGAVCPDGSIGTATAPCFVVTP